MPGSIYNWLCVAHSIVDVLSNAAVIRASQVYPRTASAAVPRNLKPRAAQPVNLNDAEDGGLGPFVGVDAGVKTPLNALDGMGDTRVGACVGCARNLMGLIKFCRYTSSAGAYHSAVIQTSG